VRGEAGEVVDSILD